MTPHEPLAQHLLTSQRRVMVSGALDVVSVADACAKLMFLDGVSDEPATILIGADSADLDVALPLLDTMSMLNMPLTVDVMGRAHGGAGVVVAAARGTRRIGASASISLRLQDPAVQGSASELAHLADHRNAQRDSVASVLALRTGQSVDWIRQEFDRGGIHAAAVAVDLGLVDEIR